MRKTRHTDKHNYFFELYSELYEKIDDFSKKNKNSLPLYFILTRRTVLFLFLFLISTTMFFFIANYQQFLDSSLLLISTIASVSAAELMCFCIISILQAVFLFVKKREISKVFLVVYVFAVILILAISLLLVIFFRAITELSQGI